MASPVRLLGTERRLRKCMYCTLCRVSCHSSLKEISQFSLRPYSNTVTWHYVKYLSPLCRECQKKAAPVRGSFLTSPRVQAAKGASANERLLGSVHHKPRLIIELHFLHTQQHLSASTPTKYIWQIQDFNGLGHQDGQEALYYAW